MPSSRFTTLRAITWNTVSLICNAMGQKVHHCGDTSKMFASLHVPYKVLLVSETILQKQILYTNYFLMISMINCKLPTDSLGFAEVRHFVNRFQPPLPSSWIRSPIKTLTRLSCSMIGGIFSQVVLLALPHILFSTGGRPDQLTNSCTSFCAILPTSLRHSCTNIW